MIEPERIKLLNKKNECRGKYVLYWMQQSQRAEYNHALEYSAQLANELHVPLLVVFGITRRFPEANARHYIFMLEGLKETQETLRARGIQLVVWVQPPREAAVTLGKDAVAVVTDRGYLRIQKEWRNHVAARVPCKMIQVESDVVVPVEVVSTKEEYGARTIRTKLCGHLSKFLKPLEETSLVRGSLGLKLSAVSLGSVDSVLDKLQVNRAVKRVESFHGGASCAKRLLGEFIADKLGRYASLRDDPNADHSSHMSPYLHFGQISPLYVVLRVLEATQPRKENKDAYIEELIVRRELSMNFCEYNPKYDSFDGLPDWAKKTLKKHQKNKREYYYNLQEFEQARTHDSYWNAAQREMVVTGKMHNYMRMYWGKKILEWCAIPEEAFRIALYLNNKYELDGRDPNSFAGVAWCFGKHDRPWPERAVFGTVRYMNAAGLKRKFDIDAYVHKIENLS